MFVGIIFINTVIGIIQEVRAKKTIDKLAILTESKTVVLRERDYEGFDYADGAKVY